MILNTVGCFLWSKRPVLGLQSQLTMEDRTDSPIAVKVEEHSRCVILTYFQGDINSMVDAHFNRALSKVCKAKAPGGKTKKIRKTIKLGKQTKSTVYDQPDYKQDNPINPHSFLCPPQKTTALRGDLLTVSQTHRAPPQQDGSSTSALQKTLLDRGPRSPPGRERARGCRLSPTLCPQKGWVLLDSNTPHLCWTCCILTRGRWDPAWPPAPNQICTPAGRCLRDLETLGTPLWALNMVSLQL